MRAHALAVLVILVGCSSSSGSNVGSLSDASSGDVILLHVDAHVADARTDAAADAGHTTNREASIDAANTDASVGFPASHPAMPQAVNLGGPVMTAPKFVVITFAGDTLAPSIDDFTDKVAASATYWSGTTAEYGVGPIGSVLHVAVTDAPAASLQDSDVQAWLTTKLAGLDAGTLEGGAPWPQPDGETVYMIYYPTGVTVTQGGGASCDAFLGYHGDFALAAGKYVTYSVVTRCPGFPGLSAIDSIASVASHEMVEAATDPLVIDQPAWATVDANGTAWAAPAGGELGDLCAGYGNVFYYPTDVPYLVQRTWSNKAAAASQDPCQPDGLSPYYNAAAEVNDTVTVEDPTLGTYTTKGLKLAVGSTATVTLDLYSDGAAAPWTVQASDLSSLFGGTQKLDVSFAGGQSTAVGSNGSQLTLTVTSLQAGGGVVWIQNGSSMAPPVWLFAVGD